MDNDTHIKMFIKIITATKNSVISMNVTPTFSQEILTPCYEKIASLCQSILIVNCILGINIFLLIVQRDHTTDAGRK